MESNHIVVAIDGEVRLPVQGNHDGKGDDEPAYEGKNLISKIGYFL